MLILINGLASSSFKMDGATMSGKMKRRLTSSVMSTASSAGRLRPSSLASVGQLAEERDASRLQGGVNRPLRGNRKSRFGWVHVNLHFWEVRAHLREGWGQGINIYWVPPVTQTLSVFRALCLLPHLSARPAREGNRGVEWSRMH